MLSEHIMLFWLIIAVVVVAVTRTSADHINKYGRQVLLDLLPQRDTLPPTTQGTIRKLNELINDQDDLGNKISMKKNNRKRGRRGGVRAKLRRRGIKTPLPAVMFGNVQSVRNKMDELAANFKYLRDFRESGFISLTETWLQEKDLDETVNIDGFSLVRGDRKDTVKQRGGGVAVYINERWCKQVNVKERLCCNDLEYLVITCRPFYLPPQCTHIPTDCYMSNER
ncbi:hypothetical protein Pmani_001956 [Petrolisthes manimaculis]|uniref:Uncharacterized protein n=1 Tax=Petrolisthes manimaculis TaxID=1843537 RepID=A0AAE1QIH7_9EUCA|nr:hypothetical protein Pmani_001956 [Petrolisthes manimaculis]